MMSNKFMSYSSIAFAAACMATTAAYAPAQEIERVAGGGGLGLATYETGNPDGPAIIFIHGFTASNLSWGRQFSGPLAEEFRLVAFDLRGHAASEKPLEAEKYTSSELWAEDVAAVIREKNLDRPVLVGWSYGGYVISDYLRAFGPDQIGGVVLVATISKMGSEDFLAFLGEEVPPLFERILAPDVRTSVGATRAFLHLLAARPLAAGDRETALSTAAMVPPEVRLSMFSRELDNDELLSGIGVPTLLIHGTSDRIVRFSSSEHIASIVPGAELLAYDGLGHVPFLEDAERFDRDLAGFVRAAHQGLSP